MRYIVAFKDNHSGGHIKFNNANWIFIAVTADNEDTAKEKAVCLFYNIHGINSLNQSCSCCSSDYDIEVCSNLCEATAYNRNCDYDENGWVERSRYAKKDVNYANWGALIPLEDYLKNGIKTGDMVFIHEINHKDIINDNYREICENVYIDKPCYIDEVYDYNNEEGEDE